MNGIIDEIYYPIWGHSSSDDCINIKMPADDMIIFFDRTVLQFEKYLQCNSKGDYTEVLLQLMILKEEIKLRALSIMDTEPVRGQSSILTGLGQFIGVSGTFLNEMSNLNSDMKSFVSNSDEMWNDMKKAFNGKVSMKQSLINQINKIRNSINGAESSASRMIAGMKYNDRSQGLATKYEEVLSSIRRIESVNPRTGIINNYDEMTDEEFLNSTYSAKARIIGTVTAAVSIFSGVCNAVSRTINERAEKLESNRKEYAIKIQDYVNGLNKLYDTIEDFQLEAISRICNSIGNFQWFERVCKIENLTVDEVVIHFYKHHKVLFLGATVKIKSERMSNVMRETISIKGLNYNSDDIRSKTSRMMYFLDSVLKDDEGKLDPTFFTPSSNHLYGVRNVINIFKVGFKTASVKRYHSKAIETLNMTGFYHGDENEYDKNFSHLKQSLGMNKKYINFTEIIFDLINNECL